MNDNNQNSKKKHRKGGYEENPDVQAAESEWKKIKGSLMTGIGKPVRKSTVSTGAGKSGGRKDDKAKGNSTKGKINTNPRVNKYPSDDRKSSDQQDGSVSRRADAHENGSHKSKTGDSGRNANRSSKASINPGKGKKSSEASMYSGRGERSSSKGKSGCPHIRDCGGCQVKQQEYSEHLKKKQSQVETLLGKFCKVENIIGMDTPYHYRNKVHAVFDHDRKGNPISGVYEEGTHRVIPVDSCLIHNKKSDEIIASIRGLLKSFKIKTYDEDSGYGLLRHVLIRSGHISGEIMVVLVIADPIFPSKNNFVKALRQLHPEITTIVLNINDKNTSMILGEREQVIYGRGYIEDTLCGKVFRISPKSFYQINSVQTEVIYGKAIELAGLTGKETVIDAYCGIGTISLIASDKASRVIGVELNKDAVKDAITNAKRNQITKAEFYNQDAGEFMTQLADRNEGAEVVFMDPPRSGSDEKFLNSLCLLKPDRIVYISCNPVTLERDLNYLTKKGYRAVRAIPVDMFPWTEHVESVILLHRKNI